MTGRFGLRGLGSVGAFLAIIALAGCTSPASGDPTRLRQEAQADLARWADAVSAAGGSTSFVPVGDSTIFVGDWGNWTDTQAGDGKLAMMSGRFETTVTLPADTPPEGQVRWQDGTTAAVGLVSAKQAFEAMVAGGAAGPCPDCVPLKITGARLTTATVRTSRGPAEAPVWEFTLAGTPARVARVAVAVQVTVVPPTWNPVDSPVGISIESARGSAAGATLTVTFTGATSTAETACGADYTAEAVESALAVVVIVTEHPHVGLPVACAGVGASRTAEVQLAAPLGDRAVLEIKEGLPVPVELTN
jgi:hypothetical protein